MGTSERLLEQFEEQCKRVDGKFSTGFAKLQCELSTPKVHKTSMSLSTQRPLIKILSGTNEIEIHSVFEIKRVFGKKIAIDHEEGYSTIRKDTGVIHLSSGSINAKIVSPTP